MNELVALYPGKELHVVLDNLSTHKPKEDRWLKSHPNVHFHFIPTHSSWLNQVECWFSILSRGALGQQFHQRPHANPGDRSLYRELEPKRSSFRVDQKGGQTARDEAFLRGLMQLTTSIAYDFLFVSRADPS